MHPSKWAIRAEVVLGVIVALSVVACAPQPGAGSGSPTPDFAPIPNIAQSSDQAAALADGSVTFEEYQAGYERFVNCAAEQGHTITYMSTTGNVIDYAMSTSSADSPEVQGCYSREFEGVDIGWQVSQDDNSETSQIMARCLEQWGMPVPETMAERMRALDAEGINFATCERS